jgi:protocatechuate 3,4-dioxygenase, alpha subunit
VSDHDAVLVASPSQTVGPFFHVGPANSDRLGRMAAADVPGEHIQLRVRVVDGDGVAVADALIELWQADAGGTYPQAPPEGMPLPPFSGFGRLGTNDEGWCTFDTVRPGSGGAGDLREAAHIAVCVFARGLLRHLYTRIYFEGDPLLSADPLLSLVPQDRRATLLASPLHDGTWEFIVRLQGDRETVFFDL